MQATILVVDDTPNNISVLMEILRDEYRALAATNCRHHYRGRLHN